MVAFNADNQNEDRQLVGTYGFISGTLMNHSGVYPLVVNFYTGNRELQTVEVAPLSHLEVENLPVERLIITTKQPYTFGLYSYCFKQVNADNDIEASTALLYSRLDVDHVGYPDVGFEEAHYTASGNPTVQILPQLAYQEVYVKEIKLRFGTYGGSEPIPANTYLTVVLSELHNGTVYKQFAIFNLYPNQNDEYVINDFYYKPTSNNIPKTIEVLVGGSPEFQQNGSVDVNTKYKILGEGI